MKKTTFILLGVLCLIAITRQEANAQYLLSSDSAFKAGTPMTGHLWGYTFGDYIYKGHSDALNRGGANQYSGMAKNTNEFDFRRIYLGYDFNINNKFSTELLLAAEDNTALNGAPANGDLLANGKFTFYVKLADVRWKNIWKGTDLVVGQSATPAFPATSEKVWGYRSIERTIADIRRTPSYDLGVSLQGKFDNKGNYGYDLMVGNGNGDKPETNNYKEFYGDLWAKFIDQKLLIDLYSDYQKLNWTPTWHHASNMIKLFVGYTEKNYAVGVEGFVNRGLKDVAGLNGANSDTLDAHATGLSMFAHANLVKNKLAVFGRMDLFNPDTKYDNQSYTTYKGFSSHYDPNTKEQFITAGLDFTPVKNVHLMPNIWYNAYRNQQANITGTTKKDYDLVYRMTFYYVFGK